MWSGGLTRWARWPGLSRPPMAIGIVAVGLLLQPLLLCADPIEVRYPEGSTRGFLVLRAAGGKILAAGDLEQKVEGEKVQSRISFHFRDGSLDEETVIFTQRQVFRVLSDHHIQKGPSFPHPLDLMIDATSGQVTLRTSDNGKEKVDQEHLDLPPDLANGILPIIVQNLKPDTPEIKLSFVAAGQKPRLIKLSIKPQGQQTFHLAWFSHQAVKFDMKFELGGVAAVAAPLLGKQPPDFYFWVLDGEAPAFLKSEGPLYEEGPIWTIQLASPVW